MTTTSDKTSITLNKTFNITSFIPPCNQKIYVAIYQSDDPYWTYDSLFKVGISSQMLGVGVKHYPYKSGDLVLNIAKSSDIDDNKPIDMALLKVKESSNFNPWKSYGEFQCYDVQCINHKRLYYNDDDELGVKNGGKVYDVARRLGIGWGNSPKCRELAMYLMIERGWG
tara:strand:- start:45 stop:551 length:507 start_codon:yes stop_codon:yes gene_type:complete